MITQVKHYAPDADLLVVKTSDGDTIRVERDSNGFVTVTVNNDSYVLGEVDEEPDEEDYDEDV